jgi:hypothetical protein
MKVIDTRRNTQAGGALSHVSTRKYVCEPCVKQLGEAMGMVSAEVHAQVACDGSDAMADCVKLAHELSEAREAQTRVVDADEILARIEKLTKPAPKPRAAQK